MNRSPHPAPSWRADLLQVFRGFLMGCADVVPGVSGGTVALILGIYERLVTAISHFDGKFLGWLLEGQWRTAAQRIDLRFLLGLAAGIGCGLITMLMLINRLLTEEGTRPLTLAAFFGLIAASSVLVGALVRPADRKQLVSCLVLGVLGAGFAIWLSSLQPNAVSGEPSLGYVFCCGAIAICAMILPGISGAMVLLLLGVYVYLSDIPHTLREGERIGHNLLVVAAFGSGCALGLLSFSRLLRWLLRQHHAHTMATLAGFMIGALPKVWPFQRDLLPEQPDFKKKVFEPYLPNLAEPVVMRAVVAAVLAMAAVFAIHLIAKKLHRPTGEALKPAPK